ncbi:MAG TPA: hypothetical protein PK442_02680 [Synergistales bacterium]|nr:hypothetical protein [Synergistales bacterium]
MDELSRKLKEIQDKMSEALHYSIDSISSLREEERERLFEVRTRKEDLIRELNEVIVAADKAESEYRRSREELLVASRSGNEKREKDAYERAMHLMKIRGAFEEREKLLARQRDDLAREERRIEKLLVRSEEMGNRFRVALNLLSMNLEGESPASSDENGLLAGMLLAERESRLAFAGSPRRPYSEVFQHRADDRPLQRVSRQGRFCPCGGGAGTDEGAPGGRSSRSAFFSLPAQPLGAERGPAHPSEPPCFSGTILLGVRRSFFD